MITAKQQVIQGQALVEGVVVLLVLVALWVSAGWLFRLQDMALQASHGSRYAAFSAARGVDDQRVQATVRQRYFSGPSHQWRTLSGRQWLAAGRPEVLASSSHTPILTANAQPGMGHVASTLLRQEWSVTSDQIIQTQVSLQPRTLTNGVAPRLSRRQFILVGAGHSVDDAHVVQRVAQSALGWSGVATYSAAQGAGLASVMVPVDQGWGRPAPQFDWLAKWQGAVPQQHLTPHTGGE